MVIVPLHTRQRTQKIALHWRSCTQGHHGGWGSLLLNMRKKMGQHSRSLLLNI